ncbi:protein singles bar [Anthonomus grandis grandis]|uniref:protein singles bar n=1 Tax=Anthonomus grandis grandis TaxID=2921223 RepID=UPI0021654EF9|nr:protein singles bar [Anthonomus grandis grandis]
MRSSRGPTIVTVPVHGGFSSQQGGIGCCCCRCCSCIHLDFFRTSAGKLKLVEVFLGFFCQSLALQYGLGYANTIGLSFQSFITNVTWCFLTTLLLTICYVFSPKSVNLIKSSVFETLFNCLAALTYLGTCSYLGYVVNVVLQPVYTITPQYQVYPAMSAAYMAGTILGLVYAYDAYKSFRYFKGYRY